jgi:hypothetical protein
VGNPAQKLFAEYAMSTSHDPTNDVSSPVDSEPTCSSSLAVYYRERLENVHRRLPEIARELMAGGVARVFVRYDGCGDSGLIEDVEYLTQDGRRGAAPGGLSASEPALIELMYDLVQCRFPGWENDEGACGDLVWDLATDSLRHTHNERFTDYHTTEYEGL